MSTTVIAASTDATSSGSAGVITLGSVSAVPVLASNHFNQFAANGLATTETVAVYILTDDAWVPLTKDGAEVELTATDYTITLHGPATYGFAKSSTAAATSVHYCNLPSS